MNEKPTALVLFAGGGGSTLGLDRAGYETLSVDNEPYCIDTLDAHGFPYQMADLSTREGRRKVVAIWRQVYENAQLDLLWASPPCQLFSKARRGRTALTDSPPLDHRADGFLWTAAMVRMLKPCSVIIENVEGAPWAEWERVMRRLYPFVEVLSLDASDLGVPQHRTRRFLLASKNPWVWEPPVVQLPRKTLRDALPWTRAAHAWKVGDSAEWGEFGGRMKYRRRGGNKPQLLDRPSPTVTCQEVKGTRASAASNWHYNGGPDRLSDALFSAVRVRRATVQDCLIIQGFPADYKLVANVEDQYRMVGNAVPPVMAEKLGAVFNSKPAMLNNEEGSIK